MKLMRRVKAPRQSGMTMIELLVAGVVLVVGFLGGMILIATAIANNNRNKIDSSATMVAQAVLEQINSTIIGTMDSQITDCAGHTYTVSTASGGSTVSDGKILFTAAVQPNYQMDYVLCAGNVQTTYDVRWRVDQITGNSFVVTVGARMKGAGGSLRYFSLPVNIRTIMGN